LPTDSPINFEETMVEETMVEETVVEDLQSVALSVILSPV